MRTFHVETVKPTHYDRDSYPIPLWKASIPSNSMARLHAIAGDCAAKRALGEDVEIEVDAYEPVPARDGDRAKIPRPGRGGGDRRLSRQRLKLWRMRSRIDRDPASKSYMDLAIAAVVDAEGENREMFDLNASPHAAVEKARRRARGRTPAEAADAAS